MFPEPVLYGKGLSSKLSISFQFSHLSSYRTDRAQGRIQNLSNI